MEDNKKGLSIELHPEVAKGTYSNLAIVTHSRSEFIVDFASALPGFPKPAVTSRIIMTPEHAKMLLNVLMDNVTKYENQYGIIDLGNGRHQTRSNDDNTFDLGDLSKLGPNGTIS